VVWKLLRLDHKKVGVKMEALGVPGNPSAHLLKHRRGGVEENLFFCELLTSASKDLDAEMVSGLCIPYSKISGDWTESPTVLSRPRSLPPVTGASST